MGIATNIIKEKFDQFYIDSHRDHGDETIIIKPEGLLPIAKELKENPDLDYKVLMDLTAVDYLGNEPRFEVVYHFYSIPKHTRLRIKVPISETNPEVDTLTVLWKGANWYEREVWDMFGIKFRGHPKMKRILLYEAFEGHPLRKDYPLKKRQPLIGPLN